MGWRFWRRPCFLPPEGYACTRYGGHKGPCAAVDVRPMYDLVKALEHGSYDSVMHSGQELHVEDLSCTMQSITYDTPMRNPRWYEFWKWGSKDYMYLLRFQQRETKLDLRPNP